MQTYQDPVEVREGPVPEDGPQQFLWRGRLWKVRAVLAHWVETGPWWQSTDTDETETRGRIPQRPLLGDLLTERELWRVEAGRGRVTSEGEADGGGVFDLAFDWAEGRWTLVGCTD